MRRPLVGMAAAFAVGIVLGEYLRLPVRDWWLCAVWLALLCVAALRAGVGLGMRTALVLLLSAAVGAAYHACRTEITLRSTVAAFLSEERRLIKFRGMVASFPSMKTRSPPVISEGSGDAPERRWTSFDLKVEHIIGNGRRIPVSGRLRVNVYEPCPDLQYGDIIEVIGKASKVRPPPNPGQFDYGKFLLRKGMAGTLSVARVRNISVVGGAGWFHKRAIMHLRKRALDATNRYLNPRAAAVVNCMLLGERNAIPEDVEKAFIRTGTVHLLAVSGLHLMILVGTVWYGLLLCQVRRKWAAAITLVFVWFFVAMTGARTPVTRAGVIATTFCVGVLLDRRIDYVNSLAAAALIILIANPAEVLGPGFQLSFLAALGIVCFYGRTLGLLTTRRDMIERLEEPSQRSVWRRVLKGYAKKNVSVSLAAWIATAPLAAHYFHTFTPFVLLFNLFAFPFVWLILSLGMAALTVIMLSSLAGGLLLQVTGGITWPLLEVIWRGSLDRVSYWYVAGPSVGWMICYYGVLLLTARRREFRFRRTLLATAALLLLIVPVYKRVFARRAEALELTVLDVGHGNAVAIHLPNGRHAFYDVGGSPNYDVGERVIAPYLWSRGVTKLDGIILSHCHYDHFGGLPSVAERFRPSRVFIGTEFGRSDLAAAAQLAAELHGAGFDVIAAGDRITGGGAEIEVLHPPRGPVTRLLRDNDTSCVVRIRWRGWTVLLTGDIQDVGTRILIARAGRVQSDVLQVPHHGDLSAGVERIPADYPARIAVISAREDEISGELLRGFRSRGTMVLQTWRDGAVTIRMSADGLQVKRFLPRR